MKQFYETGANILEPNLLCDIHDGAFSDDGNFFILTSMAGTLSIYSCFSEETYYGTPNEQIYHLDNDIQTNHTTYL